VRPPADAAAARSLHPQVNDIEDDALRQLDEARRQQAIQGTMDQVRVINQTGRQW
jgi:hypothetical protein